MSDEKQLPQAWIDYCAGFVYDLHRAGLFCDIDDMTDDEIKAALEKVRKPDYNRSSMQAPRVISEKPSSNVGLVSAPQKYVG